MTSYISIIKEASIVINKGFRVAPGEVVTVISDGERMHEAQALAGAAAAAGGYVTLLDVTQLVLNGLLSPGIPEPPKNVRSTVANSDVIIVKTNIDYAHRFAHTEAVRQAVDNGAKIASVEEGLGTWGLTENDIELVHQRTKKLAKELEGADKIHITSRDGSDFTVSIKGRIPLLVTPIREKGIMMGPMPLWGEVAYAAVEDSANGTIVCNGVMNFVAPFGVKNPIKIKAQNGRAVEITGYEEAAMLMKILESADRDANVVAEFSLGTGHLVKFGTLSEKGKYGTIHIALGDNHRAYPGGKNVSKYHIDATIRFPTVTVDGKVLIKDGEWVF
ncbi:MAG: aminopeptidase [Candidatus Caldarchaeum sp.]